MRLNSTGNRDDFPQDVKEMLAKRAGMRCSNCRRATTGPRRDPTKSVNIGVAAHITAAHPGGPRYDPGLTAVERKHINNGIWLCQSCAKLIDNDSERYAVAAILEWKSRAESDALVAVEGKGYDPVFLSEVVAEFVKVLALEKHLSTSRNKDELGRYLLRTAAILDAYSTTSSELHSAISRLDSGPNAIELTTVQKTLSRLGVLALEFATMLHDLEVLKLFDSEAHNHLNMVCHVEFGIYHPSYESLSEEARLLSKASVMGRSILARPETYGTGISPPRTAIVLEFDTVEGRSTLLSHLTKAIEAIQDSQRSLATFVTRHYEVWELFGVRDAIARPDEGE